MSINTSGYSGTPLIKKLGIRDVDKVLLINQPGEDYYALVGQDLSSRCIEKNQQPDFVHLFVTDAAIFYEEMAKLKELIKPTTVVWVSWYKKASGIKTDVTEDVIRNYALQNQLVDVKVCAVNELWSALKLVVPLALRK